MSPYRDGREMERLRTHLQQALLNDLGEAGLNCLWAHIQRGICQQVIQAHQRHPHHLRSSAHHSRSHGLSCNIHNRCVQSCSASARDGG